LPVSPSFKHQDKGTVTLRIISHGKASRFPEAASHTCLRQASAGFKTLAK
jgi:hypothetical protein